MADPRSRPRRPLLALLLLALTAAALAGAAALGSHDRLPAATGERGAEPDVAVTAETALELTPMVAERIEEMRGLRFERVPVPSVVTADRLSELIAEDFRSRRGEPREALATAEATARIVGLLGADEDLTGLVEGSGELAAAAWDTHDERLYIVSDAVGGGGALLELVLAHELVHALEDQALGLPEPPPAGDRALAEAALVEGTATALMEEYATRYIDPLALGAASLGLDAGTEGVPEFAVEQLLWTYMGGARFVERLRDLGGGWDLVDNAISRRLPTSTAQVLRPLEYLRGRDPEPVSLDASELERQGWEREEAGTLGEIATRQMIALGGEEGGGANRASEPWRGDRYELWARGGGSLGCEHPCRSELALVIRWRLDSASGARALAAAVRRYARRGLGGESAGAAAWRIEDGAVAVAAGGDEATIAFAPRVELARSLAAAG